MKPLFPPIGDPAALPRRVLVIAPHADDEVFGCGGMLAIHAGRGDAIRVVVLSDGEAGDPAGLTADIAEKRREESLAAGKELGVEDYRFLGLPDGGFGERGDLVELLRAELEDFAPELVYGPSPEEMHPDHRAAAHALLAARAHPRSARLPDADGAPRVLLYGVNGQVTANVVYDTTAVFDRKRAAIGCFESQLAYHDLVGKAEAVDRARTVNIEDRAVEYVEGFASLSSNQLRAYEGSVARLLSVVHGNGALPRADLPAATAVISTWNKLDVLRENLDALRGQTQPFESIVVVDNASTDGTAEAIAREYPEVQLIVMPHDRYGACETFNIGFASVTTPLCAILDDDVTLPPEWLERTTTRLMSEPETTAIISTEVIEPGMPAEYIEESRRAGPRYMSTFRGCGSLARLDAIRAAGFYDERLFIYGNERDLTCRLLNLGYRVLQDPEVRTYHKTPFGIQMGRRSLFYHARNAWLTMLKYAPLEDLFRAPWLVLSKVFLRGAEAEAGGAVTDATGTIGIGRAVRETPGAPWILFKAALSVLWNVPYCLKRRRPVRSEDFELPLR
ncbi:MAG: PIG-L family deacetylase [Planctomycetota bacterium]|nr:PIG-L family deacetylase [Planctomycetota bacterium]